MSKIHVLAGAGGNNVYNVVVHSPVPAGNNQAGILWSTAIINSGRNVTSMAIGTGPGQITQAEADQVAAGTVMEGQFMWGDNPAWTNAERMADLDNRASQMVTELGAQFQSDLRYYGATRG